MEEIQSFEEFSFERAQDESLSSDPAVPIVTEEEASLGRQATKAFFSDDYESCHSTLLQILDKRPDDPRVMLNLAVCEYYLDEE